MEEIDLERENRKLEITFAVQNAYNAYDFLRTEPLQDLINKAYSVFLDSNLTIEEIRKEIANIINKRKIEYEKLYNSAYVSKNHEIIYSKLKELIILLENDNVDYQLAGALCGYIKYNQESNRCHEDIDININEKDISKFKNACEKLGLSFQDNRLSSPRVLKDGIPVGEHEIIAKEKNSDFHIGAFPFERLADGTIISKGYYHDEHGNPCCKETIIGSRLAKEIFDKEKMDFGGCQLCITSPEYVYILKQYTNKEKDKHDIIFLQSKINKEKYKHIKSLLATEIATQYVQVMDLPITFDSKKSNDSSEIVDDFDNISVDNNVEEKGKQLVKKNKGSVSLFSITIIILSIITFLLIGLIIFTIIK